jgi:hypothetical protein
MAERYPSTGQGRALRLLAGGAAGGALAWLVTGVGCLIGFGPQVWVVVFLAGAVAMIFFSAGQLVQVVFADADPLQVMVASLTSYVVRVVGLAAFAVVMAKFAPELNALVLALTVVAVVAGWLGAEIWVFTRLRIPAFDPPQAETD